MSILKKLFVLALVVGVSLGTTGCSSEDEGGGDEAPATEETAEE